MLYFAVFTLGFNAGVILTLFVGDAFKALRAHGISAFRRHIDRRKGTRMRGKLIAVLTVLVGLAIPLVVVLAGQTYYVCHITADHPLEEPHYNYLELGSLNGHFWFGNPALPKHGAWSPSHSAILWDFVTVEGDTDCDGRGPTPTDTPEPTATQVPTPTETPVVTEPPIETEPPVDPTATPTETPVVTEPPFDPTETPVETEPPFDPTPTQRPPTGDCEWVNVGTWYECESGIFGGTYSVGSRNCAWCGGLTGSYVAHFVNTCGGEYWQTNDPGLWYGRYDELGFYPCGTNACRYGLTE